MKKLLIIYYSWSNGNTERIAKMLQSETDSDILKIDTVVPYSGSYDDVVFIVKYKCRKLQTKNVGRCNYIL